MGLAYRESGELRTLTHADLSRRSAAMARLKVDHLAVGGEHQGRRAVELIGAKRVYWFDAGTGS